MVARQSQSESRNNLHRPTMAEQAVTWLGRFVPTAVARFGTIPGPFREATLSFPAEAQNAEEERFRRVALSYAIIAIAAKLSRADGGLTQKEFKVFRDLFPMSGEWDSKCARIFSTAAQEPTSPSYYAAQIAALYPDHEEMLVEIFDRLFQLAVCDAPLSLEEQRILLEIAEAMKVPQSMVMKLVRRHTVKSSNPYQLLGVHKHVKEAELKKAHRRLIREYHPDGLKAYGYTDAQAARASQKLAEINAAYDAIRKSKGWK